MKVLLVNFSDAGGGAAKAAYRLHEALLARGVDSRMLVRYSSTGDHRVMAPSAKFSRFVILFRSYVGRFFSLFIRTTNDSPHSVAILPSGLVREINAADIDVVHLHWVQGEMLSIEDIGKINKPLVWTLHDMWAFSGAEHISDHQRPYEGYSPTNRLGNEHGLDVNRWIWNRKKRAWRRPINIVTPSNWLAEKVSRSVLMGSWPLTVIPNALDLSFWAPFDSVASRKLLNLPQDRKLLCIGADGAHDSSHKGFDLFKAALEQSDIPLSDFDIVIFGQSKPEDPFTDKFNIHYLGYLHDAVTMKLLYGAIDAVVLPSRIDNLPNIGVEAHACGVPVIAFDVAGLPDIVDHKVSGYLAKPFDVNDLARGIDWTLVLSDLNELKRAARDKAVKSFSSVDVANRYIGVYEDCLQRHSLSKPI